MYFNDGLLPLAMQFSVLLGTRPAFVSQRLKQKIVNYPGSSHIQISFYSFFCNSILNMHVPEAPMLSKRIIQLQVEIFTEFVGEAIQAI